MSDIASCRLPYLCCDVDWTPIAEANVSVRFRQTPNLSLGDDLIYTEHQKRRGLTRKGKRTSSCFKLTNHLLNELTHTAALLYSSCFQLTKGNPRSKSWNPKEFENPQSAITCAESLSRARRMELECLSYFLECFPFRSICRWACYCKHPDRETWVLQHRERNAY